MKHQDIAQASNPDLRGSIAAMKRAAESARRTAIQTDTEIVVVCDGKTVLIPAKQLREGGK